MLHEFKGAKRDLLQAQRLSQNNEDIAKELEVVLQKEQKYKEQEQFMYKRMFIRAGGNAMDDNKNKSADSGKQKAKDKNQNTILKVRPEFQRVVQERMIKFANDPVVTELPFPSNLSQDEIAFVAAVAKAANCSVSVTDKGVDTILKVFKTK